MPALTYTQVLAWERTQAGQDAQNRIADCFPDDSNLGLSAGQIDAAMVGMGYPAGARSPAFAVAFYLASGQNLWPQCGGVVQDPSAGTAGAGQGPVIGPGTTAPNPAMAAGDIFNSPWFWGIGIGLVVLLVVKRMGDNG